MTWLVTLLAMLLPAAYDSRGHKIFLFLAGGWFTYTVVKTILAKGQGKKIPGMPWLVFSFILLEIAFLSARNSICPFDSKSALMLVVANVLIFLCVTCDRRDGLIWLPITLGIMGLVIHLISAQSGTTLARAEGLTSSRTMFIWAADRFGLLFFTFFPPLLVSAVMFLLSGEKDGESHVARKSFLRVLGLVLCVVFWLAFLLCVLSSESRSFVWCLFLGAFLLSLVVVQRSYKKRVGVKRSLVLSVCIFLTLALAVLLSVDFMRHSTVVTALPSFQPDVPGSSLVRAARYSMPAGVGLGMAAEVSEGFVRLGDWRNVRGGSYLLLATDSGWLSFVVTLLLWVAVFLVSRKRILNASHPRELFSSIVFAGCVFSILSVAIVDQRYHLLLSSILWIFLALLVGVRLDAPISSTGKSRKKVLIHLSFAVVFGLAFLLAAAGSLKREVSLRHLERAKILMEDSESTREAVVNELRIASEWAPDDGRIDYLTGRVFLLASGRGSSPEQEDRRQARIALENAVEKCPIEADHMGVLAQVRFLAGDTEGALEMYQSAVRVAPMNTKWRKTLAGLYETLAIFGKSEHHLRILCDLEPSSAEQRYNLGRILERQNRNDEAMRAYRAALQLAPDYEPALKKIRK